MNDPILTQYQVRKSNPEKTKFIEYIKNRLFESGYNPETDITLEEKGKSIFKSRNIVVGNPATAKILMCAHYDTCAVLPFPNFMAPTNPVLFILSQLFLTVLIFAMAFVFTILFAIFTNKVKGDENYKLLLKILQECAKEKPMMFGSDQMHFEKGVGVCAVRKSPFGRYVARIHTPFDTKCRE